MFFVFGLLNPKTKCVNRWLIRGLLLSAPLLPVSKTFYCAVRRCLLQIALESLRKKLVCWLVLRNIKFDVFSLSKRFLADFFSMRDCELVDYL